MESDSRSLHAPSPCLGRLGVVVVLLESGQVLVSDAAPRDFIRIHRSTIINVHRIREVQPWSQGSHIVLLQSGEELRMSRYQREAVERLFGQRS